MNRAFSKRAILVVVCVFGALNVGGNASLKQRVNTLEVRVNGIEMRVNTDNTVIRTKVDSVKQDIESLNASVALLEDQVCPSEGSTENIGEAQRFQTVSAENVKPMQLSKMVITQGFVDEKKWIREKLEEFSNEIRNSVEGFKSNMSSFKTTLNTETDEKFTKQRNDFTEMQKAVANVETNIKKLNEWSYAIKEQMTSHFEMLQQKIQELELKIPCPHGWTKFQSFCYSYIAESKNYTSARNYCSSLNANVADIENGAESEFLVQFLERNGHQMDSRFSDRNLWLGLTDIDTEGIWKSDRTGSETIYRNWRSGQPVKDLRQNCIILGYGEPYDKWSNFPCEFLGFRFVCKKKINNV